MGGADASPPHAASNLLAKAQTGVPDLSGSANDAVDRVMRRAAEMLELEKVSKEAAEADEIREDLETEREPSRGTTVVCPDERQHHAVFLLGAG